MPCRGGIAKKTKQTYFNGVSALLPPLATYGGTSPLFTDPSPTGEHVANRVGARLAAVAHPLCQGLFLIDFSSFSGAR